MKDHSTHHEEWFRRVVARHGDVIGLICQEAFREERYHQQALMHRILERLWSNMPRVPDLVVDWRRYLWRIGLNERSIYLNSKEYRDSKRLVALDVWTDTGEPPGEALRERLNHLITLLSPEEQLIVELYLASTPRAEIAQSLHLSIPSIDRRIADIKQKLKQLNEHEEQ